MDPVSEVGLWLQLAERYGLSVVLASVTIVGLVFLVRWIGKKFDAMWEIILELQRKVPNPEDESVEKITNLNKSLRAVMREVMLDFKSSYVHIWQFHNGSRVVGKNRIPFMFISLTNELCAPDSVPVGYAIRIGGQRFANLQIWGHIFCG